MPPTPQDNNNKPKDFMVGDDTCKSCTGIVYFTKAMQKNGELPLCIGKKSVLNKKIPIDKLEELDKKATKSDLETYICIGYSQTSGRMERMGRIPICIQGVQFHFLSSTEGPGRNHGKNNNGNNNNNSNSNFPGPPIRDLQAAASSSSPTMIGDKSVPNGESNEKNKNMITNNKSSSNSLNKSGPEEFMLALTGFKVLMLKGMNKQYQSMVKFYTQTADKFPEKCYKSGRTLISSSAKTLERVERGFYKIWNYRSK